MDNGKKPEKHRITLSDGGPIEGGVGKDSVTKVIRIPAPTVKYVDLGQTYICQYGFILEKGFGSIIMRCYHCDDKDENGRPLYNLAVSFMEGDTTKTHNFTGSIGECSDDAMNFLNGKLKDYEEMKKNVMDAIDFCAESMLGDGEIWQRLDDIEAEKRVCKSIQDEIDGNGSGSDAELLGGLE